MLAFQLQPRGTRRCNPFTRHWSSKDKGSSLARADRRFRVPSRWSAFFHYSGQATANPRWREPWDNSKRDSAAVGEWSRAAVDIPSDIRSSGLGGGTWT